MHLPQLTPTQQRTMMTTVFMGYNHGNALQDGEMYDMENLSSRSYPLLDQRPRRAIMQPAGSGMLRGVQGREKLVMIRGSRVYYNNSQVTGITVSTTASMMPKQIVSMGAYVTIWPDKVYFNTADTSDCGNMARYSLFDETGGELTMCRLDGTDYDQTAITTSDTPPANPSAGDYWMDTSGDTHKLKQYSSAGEWVEIATTYVKISKTGIGEKLSTYDVVTIKNLVHYKDQTVAPEKLDPQVEALNGDKIVYGVGTNYIIIAGIIDQAISLYAGSAHYFQVNRSVPDMDYVCESNNRLWGCRYGMHDGKFLNEIRACKLGDFKNWNVFMGLSTDSYAVNVGSDGPFTGAVAQRGNPVFFKENCIHRISGSSPSSYATSVINVRGIQEGSWRSAVVIDENIFYKSREGVDYFDGSMAYSISEALGEIQYSDARAGVLNGKYYISMKDPHDEWSLFVFDTKQRLWHREDNLQVMGFGTVNGELYAIDEGEDRMLMLTGDNPDGWTAEMEEDIEWRAIFRLEGMDYVGRKYLGRFNLRMQMDEDAKVNLDIMYDQDGTWHDQGEIRGRSTRTFLWPVIPRRCDHLQIRLRGTGRCRIYSMSRVLEVGGDG